MSIQYPVEGDLERQIDLPDYIDKAKLRDIMIYRAIGYNQTEVAEQVDVSQRTVSRYLNEIQEIAERQNDPKTAFYAIFISLFADKVTEIMTLLVEMGGIDSDGD